MAIHQGHRGKINIAIDGPAGAGKSTVARLVAKQLEYIYVDTGAMYRAVTLHAIRNGIDPAKTADVVDMARSLRIQLLPGADKQIVLLNGEDVTELIRSIEVNRHVSAIAQIEGVRLKLVNAQQEMAARKGVVMDGRDIGTHVLPDAEVKIFLTASVRERAERRFKEMGDQTEVTLDQLERDIALRDRTDEQREISPLVRAEDAYLLDSSGLSIDEVVAVIIDRCRTKWGEEK